MGLGVSKMTDMQIRREGEPNTEPQNGQNSSTNRETAKLIFRKDYQGIKFDTADISVASAELLGKGSYGTSYKATLRNGNTLAVTKLKLEAKEKLTLTELEQLMEIADSSKHQNVIVLSAYYYTKDKMMFFYDYYGQCLSSLLQGRGRGLANLNWKKRLNIAIGVARAVAHIHEQDGGKHFHGNLKPSNIFLNSQGYGCIGDVGLTAMIRNIPPLPATNYRAPEVLDGIISQASDTYSFGVLLLQLLVRKFEPATSAGEVNNFVQWGKSVSRAVQTGEIFDGPLRNPNLLEVLKEAFNIGIQCVHNAPDQRPKMIDVVMKLEIIQESSSNPSV